LAAIDKPEHDVIAKQLRRVEFTEPQIREMKQYPKFILICDGYDESQQTHNLYMSNQLNQPGEWNAQVVISCRTEYIGNDYRDRFQPGDRNRQSDSLLFQEAVMAPFSLDMVHAYIQQYVSVHQPLWQTNDYKQALDLIPNLKDLMKNPFLMTLRWRCYRALWTQDNISRRLVLLELHYTATSSNNGWNEERSGLEKRI
jgi:hypothetical protein